MRIGLVLFPDITALDAVGPYEVLARVPGVSLVTVAGERGPVRAQHGLHLSADHAWTEENLRFDAVLVPGGPGQMALMEDEPFLAFLRTQAEAAKWMGAVCTGSLLLGAAGLLRGYRATTHWRYMDCLKDLGAQPVRNRVIMDRNRITAAGVAAGIDMGLFLAAHLAGDQAAMAIQLQLEYHPQPPFHSGSPELADPDLLADVEEDTQPLYDRRREQTRRIGSTLK